MDLVQTDFEGLYIIKSNCFKDLRGSFIKLYNNKEFSKHGLNFQINEYYFSTSKKNVIRGMHFQLPPFSHSKMINVLTGSIIDVVVDLRKSSKTFMKFFKVKIDNPNVSLFIPKGFAHGFKSLEDNTTVQYFVSSIYKPEYDTGIKYNSFGYDWDHIENPIISERDKNFVDLDSFKEFFE